MPDSTTVQLEQELNFQNSDLVDFHVVSPSLKNFQAKIAARGAYFMTICGLYPRFWQSRRGNCGEITASLKMVIRGLKFQILDRDRNSISTVSLFRLFRHVYLLLSRGQNTHSHTLSFFVARNCSLLPGCRALVAPTNDNFSLCSLISTPPILYLHLHVLQ